MSGGLLPGLGASPIDLSPIGPNEWKIWPDEEGVTEAHAMRLSGPDPLSVVTGIVAKMMAQGMGPLPGDPDDYFARGSTRQLRRVRVMRGAAEVLTIAELQACRVCGCCQDRACNPPCSWIEPDLCSACKGKG